MLRVGVTLSGSVLGYRGWRTSCRTLHTRYVASQDLQYVGGRKGVQDVLLPSHYQRFTLYFLVGSFLHTD